MAGWSRNEVVAELKLGYKASAEQFAPRELVELAVAAEAHGMDSATVSDHFQPWRHWVATPVLAGSMTAVGERTERLILAREADSTFRTWRSSRRRSHDGCLYPIGSSSGGTGESLNEIATGYQATGPSSERHARLREAVRLMRELWS
jgi:coenzyme F420-dependent glucose-6-phosphate dehydrogenase